MINSFISVHTLKNQSVPEVAAGEVRPLQDFFFQIFVVQIQDKKKHSVAILFG